MDLYIHPTYKSQGEKKKILDYVIRVESLKGESVVDMLGSSPRFLSSNIPKSTQNIQQNNQYKGIGKSASQTNLNALGGQERINEMRKSKLFNSIGRELVNATPEISKYGKDDLNDRVEISQDERKISSHNNNPTIFNNGSINVTNSPGFDNYYSEYQKRKDYERNKSQSEHRSKYCNDLFSSTVNLGLGDQKILREIEIGGKLHYKNHLTQSFSGIPGNS